MKTAFVNYNYEKERERDLIRQWRQNKDVIDRLLLKFHRVGFLQYDEFDDYRQEIFIWVWNKYHKWMENRHSFEFSRWLYMTARTCLFSVRMKKIKRSPKNVTRNEFYRLMRTSREVLIEDVEAYDRPVENYSEEKFEALQNVIATLPKFDQKVIQLFCDGEEFQHASLVEGKHMGFYSGHFTRIKKKIRALNGDFFEDMPCYIKPQPRKSHGRGILNAKAKKVKQLDFDGNLIRLWDCLNDAERDGGFNAKNISACLCGEKGSHRNFIWLSMDATEENIAMAIARVKKSGGQKTVGKAIIQYTVQGVEVRRFQSISEVEQFGFAPTNVSIVVRGKAKTHMGFVWKYADELPISATA